MTVKEMHLALEHAMQKINSNQTLTFTSEQLDFMLNVAQDSYVREIGLNYKNGNIDYISKFDITNLFEKRNIKVFHPKPTSMLYEENSLIAVQPKDCIFINDMRARALTLTAKAQCSITPSKFDIQTDTALQKYVCVIPFVNNIQQLCSNSTMDFRIILKGVRLEDDTYSDYTLFDYQDFDSSQGMNPVKNIPSDDYKYVLVNLVLEYFNRYNSNVEGVHKNIYPVNTDLEERNHDSSYFEVYWEEYAGQYYPNCFIFVSNNRNTVSEEGTDAQDTNDFIQDTDYNTTPMGIRIQIYSNSSLVSQQRFKQLSYYRETLNAVDYNDTLNPYTTVELAKAEALRKQQEIDRNYIATIEFLTSKKSAVLRDPFLKPNRDKVLYNTSKSAIFLFVSPVFTVDELKLEYLRKPRRINLGFSQSCELHEMVHQKIVDKAAIYGLETLQSPRLQTKYQESIINK